MLKLKDFKILLFLIAVGFFSLSSIQAQSLKVPIPSPLQKVSQQFALTNIDIEYSRPSVKGRVIFSDLVPYGKMWRTGANASTKVTFGSDVKVNDKDLTAGTYALYTIPGQNEWQIIFYSDLTMGTNFEKYNKKDAAAILTVPVEKSSNIIETFTIQVENITTTSANMTLSWENSIVSVSVTTEIDAEVMTGIEKAMKDNRPYYQASVYYLENDKDLNQAYEWAVKAAEQNPNAYWIALHKATLEFKTGKYKDAIASANKVISMTSDQNYVKAAKEIITDSNSKLSNKK